MTVDGCNLNDSLGALAGSVAGFSPLGSGDSSIKSEKVRHLLMGGINLIKPPPHKNYKPAEGAGVGEINSLRRLRSRLELNYGTT